MSALERPLINKANVYHAHRADMPPGPYPDSLAVKIYRTSILGFRSRQEYMQGEHRFRGEYTSSKNPRKMVKLWAEKEFRNLRRLEEEHIRCPRALECKENVLVLEYLGDGLEYVSFVLLCHHFCKHADKIELRLD